MISHKGFSIWQGLLIVVAICLVAFTGWFVWQSQQRLDKIANDSVKNGFIAKKKISLKTPTAAKLQEYCVKNEKICFDYPSDWSVAATELNQPEITTTPGDKLEIKNASGSTVLKLQTGYGGLGGTCEDATGEKTVVKEAVATNLDAKAVSGEESKFLVPKLYVTKVVAYDDKSFSANVYLTNNKEYVTLGEKSVLGICFSPLFTGRNVKINDGSSAGGGPAAMSFIATSTPQKTRSEAEDVLKSDDFVKADAILMSIRY